MRPVNIVVAMYLIVFIGSTKPGRAGRFRRTAANFANMITCATKRQAYLYNNYGCYCGYGGHGTPVDATDECCRIHDNCCGKLQSKMICPYFEIYLQNYKYDNHRCTCASGGGRSAQRLCQCDMEAARCFAKAKFDPRKRNIDRAKEC